METVPNFQINHLDKNLPGHGHGNSQKKLKFLKCFVRSVIFLIIMVSSRLCMRSPATRPEIHYAMQARPELPWRCPAQGLSRCLLTRHISTQKFTFLNTMGLSMDWHARVRHEKFIKDIPTTTMTIFEFILRRPIFYFGAPLNAASSAPSTHWRPEKTQRLLI